MAENTATRRVVKARKKSTAAKQVNTEAKPDMGDPWVGSLDAGDRLEFAATVEVQNSRGRSYWPRAGVTITVRPGETVDQAKARASTVVHGFLDEQVADYLAK